MHFSFILSHSLTGSLLHFFNSSVFIISSWVVLLSSVVVVADVVAAVSSVVVVADVVVVVAVGAADSSEVLVSSVVVVAVVSSLATTVAEVWLFASASCKFLVFDIQIYELDRQLNKITVIIKSVLVFIIVII